MNLKKKISAVKVPHNKHTAAMQAVSIAPPKEVLIPMNMGGQASVPVVEVGDYVRVGQLIAREDGKVGCPIHASISGTVTAIEEYKPKGGRPATAIRIKGDGKMEKSPDITVPHPTNVDEFLDAVLKSGLVGLGGASFPLWAKFDAIRKGPINTVLINGAECEPYITTDHRTMLDHTEDLAKGIELLKEFLKSEEFIIGIESNKPDAIAKLTERFKDDSAVKVMPLDSIYPQGAKQVLLYNALGKVVAEGQRLNSLGVIIINVSSLAKMGQYFTDGMPLVDKVLTVDGSCVKNPGNYTVPIGTSIGELLELTGGTKGEVGKLIYGGPMMGKTADGPDAPVLKATNAILAFDRKECEEVEPSACIHCGRCVAHCPLSLNPTAYAHALELEDDEAKLALLEKEKVQLCMECGCCSFICPAHRPLVENNRKAKGFVKKARAAAAEKK